MNQVKVGIGVLIIKNKQVLFGQRKGSHGDKTWAPPGGHLEFGETPEACAIREVKEETGLTISSPVRGLWTNDYFKKEDKHYITLYMLAKWSGGEPQVLEPNKCSLWQWFDWEHLPQPLFLTIKNLKQQGFDPSEVET